MSVLIRATIRQVGKQIPLVVVLAEPTLLLLHGVHLKTNCHVCGYAYLNRNYCAHLVKFRADAAIDHVGLGFTIVHAHVILVLEAINFEARTTLCHRLVPRIHRVVYPWNTLGCYADSERVHFRAQVDELDDRISFHLVLEKIYFSSV